MEREACVCDHGYERSDLCAEIIIIIIITYIHTVGHERGQTCCLRRVSGNTEPKLSHSEAYFLSCPQVGFLV